MTPIALTAESLVVRRFCGALVAAYAELKFARRNLYHEARLFMMNARSIEEMAKDLRHAASEAPKSATLSLLSQAADFLEAATLVSTFTRQTECIQRMHEVLDQVEDKHPMPLAPGDVTEEAHKLLRTTPHDPVFQGALKRYLVSRRRAIDAVLLARAAQWSKTISKWILSETLTAVAALSKPSKDAKSTNLSRQSGLRAKRDHSNYAADNQTPAIIA